VRANQILGIVAVLCGFLQEGFSQVQDSDWKTIDQPDYSLTYPARWTLDKGGQMGTKFILFTGQSKSGFSDNLNLIIEDLGSAGFDLERYASLSEGQIRKMIANVEDIDSKRQKSGDKEFQEVIFKGDQGTLHLKWRQRYYLKGDKAYVLTFTSSQATYDQYTQLCQKLFDSFVLK
jgi:hypothetical protein